MRKSTGLIYKKIFLIVATCYHVYSRDGLNPIEVKVIYHLRVKNGLIKYDSTFATLNYPVKAGQYDFKRHKFDTTNDVTDFIVLKLTNKVKNVRNVFDTSHFRVHQNLLTVKQPLEIASSNALAQLNFKTYTQTVSFGYAIGGFSGSPLYTSSGKISGMHWGSIRGRVDISTFLEILEAKGVPKSDTDFIRNSLKKYPNYNLALSLDIKSLINIYLKGYL